VLGGPLGTLGFPISDEIPVGTVPGSMIRFQKEKMTWQGVPTQESISVLMDAMYNFRLMSYNALLRDRGIRIRSILQLEWRVMGASQLL
jgi:hypothetical protein